MRPTVEKMNFRKRERERERERERPLALFGAEWRNPMGDKECEKSER